MKANSEWLASLKTETPQDGFDLAIKLARMAVKKTQPDEKARNRLRDGYVNDPDALIAASHVVAVHFSTVAAANAYWKDFEGPFGP